MLTCNLKFLTKNECFHLPDSAFIPRFHVQYYCLNLLKEGNCYCCATNNPSRI